MELFFINPTRFILRRSETSFDYSNQNFNLYDTIKLNCKKENNIISLRN